jgi:hypothetical protein
MTYRCLPYNHLPCIMIKVLVNDFAKKLNFFPVKNGISQYYSLHMILHQWNLDYNKHCQYAFGTYVQAPMSLIYPILMPLAPWIAFIFNTMTTSKEAMIYCICKAMNRMITCHHITPIPITPGSDHQDGTLHCQERWYAKRFEDNQLHRTSPLW